MWEKIRDILKGLREVWKYVEGFGFSSKPLHVFPNFP